MRGITNEFSGWQEQSFWQSAEIKSYTLLLLLWHYGGMMARDQPL